MRVSLRTDKNPPSEGVLDLQAALYAFPDGATISVDLSGLSFYRASLYDFMTEEEEDLDL